MNYLLLLGAGFSRNWGGWLAQEAFEYLLGSPDVDDGLRSLLWQHRTKGGFESALGVLQDEHFRSGRQSPEARLVSLQNAIKQMFADMNKTYYRPDFIYEFQQTRDFMVNSFLARFDAIFTLNQDLLIERRYIQDNGVSLISRRWSRSQIPGIRQISRPPRNGDPNVSGLLSPDSSTFSVAPRQQPYFKLHGSSNWIDPDGQGLLVLGGNKLSMIKRHPVLEWYFDQFRDYLSQPNVRLMVIGYSFGDDHINNLICEAAAGGGLEIFIIDPIGVDILDKNLGATIHSPGELALQLWPRLCGTSRRSLREIFGSDRTEHAKVMRFFA